MRGVDRTKRAVPIPAFQHRSAAGRFHATASTRARCTGIALRRSDPARICRVDTRLQAMLVLLLVANAGGAPARVPRAPRSTAVLPAVPCPTLPPLTVPQVMHDAAALIRAPVSSVFDAGRYVYYHAQHRCPPPQSDLERTILQVGDLALTLAESEVLGSSGAAIVQDGAVVLDATADALEDRPLDLHLLDDALRAQAGFKPVGAAPHSPHPALAEEFTFGLNGARADSSLRVFNRAARVVGNGPALDPAWIDATAPDAHGLLRYRNPATGEHGLALRLDGRYHAVEHADGQGMVAAGVALERRDGIYWLRRRSGTPNDVDADDANPAQRCRRAPGAACAPATAPAGCSSALERLLQTHHASALSEEQATQRGIVPDPERPGWYVRVHAGERKAFLNFQGRYFRVKSYRLGTCERMAVYAPRIPPAVGVRIRHPLGGQRLADIAESPATRGPQFMTQAEFNVRFRGFSSLEAAHVYEQAIRNAPAVHLRQAEHRAILRYAASEHPELDRYLRDEVPSPFERQDFAQQVQDIRSGLAQIAPHPGRVYRGATIETDALEGIAVGQTVYLRTFLRASGARDVAEQQLQARAGEAGRMPLLVTLRMARGAHPIGLYTLRDEAEVLIDRGRVFKVTARREGELELEEAGVVRQSFGQAAARTLDLF
jgi:hypothetical protein